VGILKQFADKEIFLHITQVQIPQIRCFINRTPKLVSPKDQSYAYAYSLRIMAIAGKDKDVESLFSKMVDAWLKIGQKWDQVKIGFDLVTVVAKTTPELARQLLERVKQERESTSIKQICFCKIGEVHPRLN